MIFTFLSKIKESYYEKMSFIYKGLPDFILDLYVIA